MHNIYLSEMLYKGVLYDPYDFGSPYAVGKFIKKERNWNDDSDSDIEFPRVHPRRVKPRREAVRRPSSLARFNSSPNAASRCRNVGDNNLHAHLDNDSSLDAEVIWLESESDRSPQSNSASESEAAASSPPHQTIPESDCDLSGYESAMSGYKYEANPDPIPAPKAIKGSSMPLSASTSPCVYSFSHLTPFPPLVNCYQRYDYSWVQSTSYFIPTPHPQHHHDCNPTSSPHSYVYEPDMGCGREWRSGDIRKLKR